MSLSPIMKPLYELLKKGPLDTKQIQFSTRATYTATINRLYKLRARGLIKNSGRRDTKDGTWLIWSLVEQQPKTYEDGDIRVAGRITIGRGSRWGAGLV